MNALQEAAQFRAIVQRAARRHRLQRKAHLNIRRAEIVADKPAALVQVLFEVFAVRRDLFVEVFALHALADRAGHRPQQPGIGGWPRRLNTSFITNSGISDPSA